VFLEQFVHVRKFDAIVLGWVGADSNPDKYQIWHSSQGGNHKLNFVGYSSPEADALIEEIRIEYDREKQIELTRRLHRRIAEDQPYTFLYEPARPYALDARLSIRVPPSSPGAKPEFEKIVTTPSGEINYFFKRWVMNSGAASLAE
jgi:ABC-type transport system substrate-binding protein